MFKKFISDTLLKSNSVAGVECFYHSNDKVEFRLIILNNEKGRISVKLLKDQIENEEELLSQIPSHLPIVMVVNGRIVLHKKIQFREEEQVTLHRIFPNADINDFYIQKSEPLLDSTCNVSIVRKSVLDILLNKIYSKGHFILSCYFGPFIIESLLPYLSPDTLKQDNIMLADYKLHLVQQRVFDFELEPASGIRRKIEVSGITLEENFLISFASAFECFIKSGHVKAAVISIANSKEEYKEKKIFKLTGWAATIFFFILLLVNFFIFDHYNKLKNVFEAEIMLNQDKLKQFDAIQIEITEKKKFLESTGLLDAPRTSFYADQIAEEVPASILLKDMNIQPFVKKSGSEEDKVFFLPKVINISGSCKKSIDLNEWIKILKIRYWVKSIAIVNYSQDKEEGIGNFSLEIRIK